MGFALVGVLMAAGSLNLGTIIEKQSGGFLSWNWFWLFPLFVVYFISGVAETNRAPLRRGGRRIRNRRRFPRGIFRHRFRAVLPRRIREHDPDRDADRRVLLRRLQSPLHGYLAPDAALFQIPVLGALLNDGLQWLVIKTFGFLFLFLWLRATFPRYRYDQIMRLGWKALIPVTIVWIFVEMLFAWYKIGPWSA